MSEDIHALIEKINQEGIQAAEKKAKEIEVQAKEKARQILEEAQQNAEEMLEKAKKEIAEHQESQKEALMQVARDLLLVVKQEINALLGRIITQELSDTLRPENLYQIILETIKAGAVSEKNTIQIYLSAQNLKIIEESFLAKLKEQTKKEIILKPRDEVGKGFCISFDAGKSEFDFSQKALVEYIITYLKPRLKEILEGIKDA